MLNYIALLIPLFLGLIALEWWYSRKRNDSKYSLPNTALNMAVGAIDQFGALLYLLLLYLAMVFSKAHFQWLTLPNDWRQWILAFLVVDFVSYWYHRCSHQINLLWAGHVTHHSSSYFNLSNGFRTSPFQGLFRIPFWMIMPVFGFDPLVLVITFKVVGLHDFFVHTPYIPKLGWLEWFIVTPSHHRVHHGKNEIYIDKNYGSVLILWDRMFGTFQDERADIPAVYGVTRPVRTWNPIKINFMHLWLLAKDAWHTKSRKDKLRVWLMPLGWRPADVIEKYPVYKIEDVYDFEKYDTPASKGFQAYLWAQLICMLLIVSYLFGNVAMIKDLGIANLFIYGLFIFVQVYALTELMDRAKYAWVLEAFKNAVCIYFIIQNEAWFGSNTISPIIAPVLIGYFVLSSVAVYYFSRSAQENSKELNVA